MVCKFIFTLSLNIVNTNRYVFLCVFECIEHRKQIFSLKTAAKNNRNDSFVNCALRYVYTDYVVT